MSWFSAAVTMAASVLTLTVIVEVIARVRHPRRLFLMDLGRERTEADDARATRLRLANAVSSTVALGLIAVDPTGTPAIVAVVIVPTILTGWLLVELALTVRSIEPEKIPGRYRVVLTDAPPARAFMSIPLQVINVLSLLVPSAVFAWILTQLPSAVPLHWDGAGNVDRVGSPGELWMMAALIAFDLVLLWGIVYGVTRERWALPEHDTERYAELAFERRRLLVRFVEWLMAAINVSMGFMWLVITLGWFESTKHLLMPLVTLSVVLMTVGCIAPMIAYLRPLMKVQDGLRAIAGTEVLGTRASGWRLGGTVYYAPEDPAVMVPRRVGIGMTLNFGRPVSWVILIGVLVVPLLISLIAVMAG